MGRLDQWSAGGGRTSVLRAADQRAGRAPSHCVTTGASTSGAVRVRAVGLRHAGVLTLLLGAGVVRLLGIVARRPAVVAVIVVSPAGWSRRRRSLFAPVVVGAAGGGFLVAGVVGTTTGLVVVGGLVVLGAWALRVRATRRWWIGARYRPDDGTIVVTHASVGFDDDARVLFIAGVNRT